jgi:hypothetical protein
VTRAVQQGRQLALYVDGIDEPFLVDPIPAKRGRALTEAFVAIAMGAPRDDAMSESLFIESLNARNYSRAVGGYVDEFDAAGAYVTTWSPDGAVRRVELADAVSPVRFLAREAIDEYGEADVDGEAIRQEEAESLSLCAFYWQSVVGIEAVNTFLESGEGTAASLKALNLLLIRIGRSPSRNSLQAVTESLTQQDDSEETTDTGSSSSSVPLPANKRSFLQNPAKARRKSRRR